MRFALIEFYDDKQTHTIYIPTSWREIGNGQTAGKRKGEIEREIDREGENALPPTETTMNS